MAHQGIKVTMADPHKDRVKILLHDRGREAELEVDVFDLTEALARFQGWELKGD